MRFLNKSGVKLKPLLITVGISSLFLTLTYLLISRYTAFMANILLVIIGIYIFISVLVLALISAFLAGKKPSLRLMYLCFNYLKIHFPLIAKLCGFFNIDIDNLRHLYVLLNNYIVKTRIQKFSLTYKPEDILVLMPHCIQSSACNRKVTNDIKECISCGNCKVGSLKEIESDYGISVKMASGGTLARKVIIDSKPRAVIAVACERDLVSGISDISPGLPVIGVFNSRINGPCYNTDVDLDKIIEELDFLIDGPGKS